MGHGGDAMTAITHYCRGCGTPLAERGWCRACLQSQRSRAIPNPYTLPAPAGDALAKDDIESLIGGRRSGNYELWAFALEALLDARSQGTRLDSERLEDLAEADDDVKRFLARLERTTP